MSVKHGSCSDSRMKKLSKLFGVPIELERRPYGHLGNCERRTVLQESFNDLRKRTDQELLLRVRLFAELKRLGRPSRKTKTSRVIVEANLRESERRTNALTLELFKYSEYLLEARSEEIREQETATLRDELAQVSNRAADLQSRLEAAQHTNDQLRRSKATLEQVVLEERSASATPLSRQGSRTGESHADTVTSSPQEADGDDDSSVVVVETTSTETTAATTLQPNKRSLPSSPRSLPAPPVSTANQDEARARALRAEEAKIQEKTAQLQASSERLRNLEVSISEREAAVVAAQKEDMTTLRAQLEVTQRQLAEREAQLSRRRSRRSSLSRARSNSYTLASGTDDTSDTVHVPRKRSATALPSTLSAEARAIAATDDAMVVAALVLTSEPEAVNALDAPVLRDKLRRTASALSEKDEQVEELSEQMDMTLHEVREITQDIRVLEAELRDKGNLIEHLEGMRAEQMERIESLQKELDAHRSRKKSGGRRTSNQSGVSGAIMNSSGVSSSGGEDVLKPVRLERQLSESQSVVAQLERDLNEGFAAAQSDIELRDAKIATLLKRIEGLEMQLAMAEESAVVRETGQSTELFSAQQRICDLESRTRMMEEDVKGKQEEMEELRARMLAREDDADEAEEKLRRAGAERIALEESVEQIRERVQHNKSVAEELARLVVDEGDGGGSEKDHQIHEKVAALLARLVGDRVSDE